MNFEYVEGAAGWENKYSAGPINSQTEIHPNNSINQAPVRKRRPERKIIQARFSNKMTIFFPSEASRSSWHISLGAK